jgi:ABC-type nitrate/sulfonate/bicarbonate transport system substrate-binding protein
MKILPTILATSIVYLTVASCGPSDLSPGNKGIVLQLNWTPDATFAGEYIAADKGYYEGLSVDIQAGGFGIDPFASIVSKKAQFAVVGADKAAIAFANGAPIRVVAVDFQRNPVGWIVRASKNVKTLKQVAGRNDLILGDKIGTETTAILDLMLKRLGLAGQISPKGVGFELAYFFQNENVIYPVYLNEEPVRAKLEKIDIVEIDPSVPENGGVKLYGNVLIAHKEFVANNPKIVRSFVSGVSKGWRTAKENLTESEALLRTHKEFNVPSLSEVLRRSVEFATLSYGTTVPPGHMELAEWRSTLAVLKEGAVITKDIDVQEFVWLDDSN